MYRMSLRRSAVIISPCLLKSSVLLTLTGAPLSPNVSRFMIREFMYSEEAIAKQRDELQVAGTTEKELWVH